MPVRGAVSEFLAVARSPGVPAAPRPSLDHLDWGKIAKGTIDAYELAIRHRRRRTRRLRPSVLSRAHSRGDIKAKKYARGPFSSLGGPLTLLKRAKGRVQRLATSLVWSLSAIALFKNWWTYFALLRARGEGRRVLETRKGEKLSVRENVWDARIIREIFVERPYTKGIHDLPPNPVVVDVGGYIGDFSIYAASRLNASVIVYEPTSENWAMLKDNVARNGLESRVTPVNKAVGRDGTLTLNVEVSGQEVHSSSRWYPSAPKREVQSVTPDQIVADHQLDRIDLLKVDCEGGEYELFRHASDDALERVDRLTLEWHGVGPETDELLCELLARLSAVGFHLRATGPQVMSGAR